MSLQLFNNVGVEADVLVNYNMCIAYTTDGSEVGIIIQDDADYHIQAVDQYYTIQNGTGAIGGGASYSVSLINTVPIALTVFQLSNAPDILTPSAEPFDDVNGNGEYDPDEPFTDWNQNEQWSPIIEPIGLSDGWEVDVTVAGNNLIVGISNWDEPLEPAPHELFKVNCLVNDQAELNDITTISTNVQLILDAWGNSGVPFINGNGTVTINEVLSSDNESRQIPKSFSLDRVYPNPFNPMTSISFSVPLNNEDHISIKVFDISGRLATTLVNERSYDMGRHEVVWDAKNLGSGIYFVEFRAGIHRQVEKITLLK
jgi:hypothetical protein